LTPNLCSLTPQFLLGEERVQFSSIAEAVAMPSRQEGIQGKCWSTFEGSQKEQAKCRVGGKVLGGDSGLGDAGERWLREASSYCQWVLSGPPGILGQWNGPSRAL